MNVDSNLKRLNDTIVHPNKIIPLNENILKNLRVKQTIHVNLSSFEKICIYVNIRHNDKTPVMLKCLFEYKLKVFLKEEHCKQCKYVKFKGTVTKWAVLKPTHRTTQKP